MSTSQALQEKFALIRYNNDLIKEGKMGGTPSAPTIIPTGQTGGASASNTGNTSGYGAYLSGASSTGNKNITEDEFFFYGGYINGERYNTYKDYLEGNPVTTFGSPGGKPGNPWISAAEFLANDGVVRGVQYGSYEEYLRLTGFYGESTTSTTGSTPTGSTPTGSTPTGSTPTGSTPTGETPTGETPTGSTPTGSTTTGSTTTGSTPTGSTPTGETPTGETPTGETPTGETPTGETTTGETPTGETPTGENKKEPIGYGDWLERQGLDAQADYERAVAAARREYDMNRATFGLRGEQMGRAGLTRSGYGDYLEGKAYASMVGAMSEAEIQRNANERMNRLGYANYLEAKDNEAYQNKLNVYNALAKAGTTDTEVLTSIAKMYGKDMSDEEIAELVGLVGKQQEGVRQTTISSLIGKLSDPTYAGTTIEGYTSAIKSVLPDATDEEIASIISQVETSLGEKIKTEAEVTAETEAALKDDQDKAIRIAVVNAIAEGKYTTVADWEFAAKQMGYTEDQIEVGRQTIYDYGARNVEMMIENAASLSDMAAMTPAEFEKAVGKTLDQARADELMKKVNKKTGEILRQALEDYQAGDDSSVAALLGVEPNAFDKMSDGEKADAIFQATMEQYRIGTINVETTKEIAFRMMTKTLQSKGTDMETIAGMSILLDNEFGASGDPVLVAANDRWQNVLTKYFDVSTIGTAEIFITTNGKKQRVGVIASDDEAIDLPTENGTLQVNNGELYMYNTIRDGYIKVETITGGVMSKDKEAALLKLLILKLTK